MPNLDSVLFVRVASGLLEGLDDIVASEMAKSPGKKVTRSDVARMLLIKELKRVAKKTKK